MKIRTFLQTLLKSITSPQYYLDVLNAPFRFSFKFFIVSYALLSFLATFFFIQLDVPKYQALFNQNIVTIQKDYPADLQLSWNRQALTSSQTQPLQITYPQGVPHSDFPASMATLDPAASSIDQVPQNLKSSSLFVVTKDTLYVSNSQGGWSPLDLKETPGFDQAFVINQTTLPVYLNDWRASFGTLLQGLMLFFPLGYFFGIGLSHLLSLVLDSVFVYYLLKFLGRYIQYKKIIQLCLHVAVVAGLVDVLTSHFIHTSNVDMYGLTFWLYLIIVLLALWNVKNVVIFKTTRRTTP